MQKDYYSILGISSTSTLEEIKKAYRVNAIKYHPDKNFGDPAFAHKFLEIKEAYDNLIDPDKRRLFDFEYQEFFKKTDTNTQTRYQQQKQEEKYQQKQKEEKFRYDPYTQFYSSLDREQQDTPQFEPKKTPWGEDINEALEFFTLPKNIGKLIGGYSTIVRGTKSISFWKLVFTVIISSYIILPVLAIIMFLIWQHWHFNLHKEDATQTLLITYGVIALLIIGFRVANHYNVVAFKHLNYFIGVNGFALFRCEGTKENVTSREEVNFNNVTDLVTRQVVNKRNFSYVDTNYQFLWLNTGNKKMVFESVGSYTDEKGEPNKYTYPEYWLNKEAEKYWTVYLLDNMENKLQQNGYLEFNIYVWGKATYIPYIRLGNGYITFLQGNESVTYKFNEIKRMYTKGTELFIEHKNYEKILFFFKSGNKNSIPLDAICNRLFFMKATELLLGYSIA
jgi:curved DNA-binding protein CbpA